MGGQADVYPNNTSGERVNLAVAGDVTSPTELSAEMDSKFPDVAENIVASSDAGGIEVLTIATNVAVGTTQVCKSAIIWTDSADVTMKIGTSAADANDFLMLQNTYLPVPINDVALLRFYGATDDAKIYILWRG